jgi:hypothetical protein
VTQRQKETGDDSAQKIAAMIEKAETMGPAYWHSCTPQERLHALEFMRQRAYGYDPATVRFERVIDILKLSDV